jgi:ABC-type Fe3+/spermidine/putrescine transport system ATPase subunit
MNRAAIEINNLTKQFGNVWAVKNISFKINKGKIIGLLGPNGCGQNYHLGYDVRFNKTHLRKYYY